MKSRFISALAVLLLAGSVHASDDYASNKLGRPPGGVLRTQAGKIYEDARVIQVDPNGVLFRHRDGTGRLLLVDLTPELQAHYGYDVKMAWAFETGQSETEEASETVAGNATPGGVPPMVLTFRTRTILPPTPAPTVVWAPVLWCGNPAQLGYAWPSYWSRFHHGLAYSSFPWRQLAERDFLISSGLLPHPPGVRTWRLR